MRAAPQILLQSLSALTLRGLGCGAVPRKRYLLAALSQLENLLRLCGFPPAFEFLALASSSIQLPVRLRFGCASVSTSSGDIRRQTCCPAWMDGLPPSIVLSRRASLAAVSGSKDLVM